MSTKKQDPRAIRTQRLLKQAFIELMDEREFEQITVQDISDRATVKRVTFYLHYKDKYDLMNQCIDEILNDLHDRINEKVSFSGSYDFLEEQPHPSFVQLFHHIGENYPFYSALLVTNRIPNLASGLLKIIHEFISEGINQIEPNDQNLTADRNLIIKFVESAFLEVIIWWIENGMHLSEKEIAFQLMNVSIKGPYIHNPMKNES
ncbi:TetR/AcrR family transcriptional regulator [Ferdinandcohnia quinoae]|uniref:TetR/AcrR family transcriptional regulator C-terminal domain-containing protein n=1 Tax=Fredinandcohnia quinoae TaxID=2918902 RepID=A0AAW5DZA6_9BACI|nr:TetR/AcrR family transcriptional regulator C-terminal domain-containing protein [Fredinandcohnia sp. SECRCQ15]MCH1625982.1 TetR/AcrR family transcriptional regulator C-terminal domain-containing protein [Fredinandcohnia sp. SECRCQ15]